MIIVGIAQMTGPTLRLPDHHVDASKSYFALYILNCQRDPVLSYPSAFAETPISKPSHCSLRITYGTPPEDRYTLRLHPGLPWLDER
jgi:hypothetical protein